MMEGRGKHCQHCGEDDCFEHCPSASDGKHTPDWRTLKLADGEAFGPGAKVVMDVWCKYCGISGSISLDASKEEVNW